MLFAAAFAFARWVPTLLTRPHSQVTSPRRAITAAALFALAGASADAQVFQRLVGTQVFESVEALRQTFDTGYVTAGDINPAAGAGNRFNVIRYNPDGTIAWSTMYGGPEPAHAYDVVQAFDTTFVATGRHQAAAAPLGLALLRLDPAGNFIWAWQYQGDGAPFDPVNFNNIASVAIDNIGDAAGNVGYIVATAISVGGPFPNGDLGQLLRTDAAGGQIFNRAYFDTRFGQETRVSFTDVEFDRANASFVISGTSETRVQPIPGGPFQQRREVLFVRTDMAGNVLFSFTYGLPPDDAGNEVAAWGDGIELTESGDVVIAGHTNQFGVGVPGAIVLRINPGGGLIWSETFKDFAPHFRAVHESPDRTIGVVGTAVVSAAAGAGPMALLTLDPGGAPIFERVYGPLTNPDFGKALTPLRPPACGWALVGDKNTPLGFGLQDILLARADQFGRTGCFENRVPVAMFPPHMNLAEIPLQPIDMDLVTFWQAPLNHPNTQSLPLCFGPVACPGDANGDGVVTFADVTNVLAHFGMIYPAGCLGPGDANGDGVVSFADVTLVLANFGNVCP